MPVSRRMEGGVGSIPFGIGIEVCSGLDGVPGTNG
jgi:hypothetical protein